MITYYSIEQYNPNPINDGQFKFLCSRFKKYQSCVNYLDNHRNEYSMITVDNWRNLETGKENDDFKERAGRAVVDNYPLFFQRTFENFTPEQTILNKEFLANTYLSFREWCEGKHRNLISFEEKQIRCTEVCEDIENNCITFVAQIEPSKSCSDDCCRNINLAKKISFIEIFRQRKDAIVNACEDYLQALKSNNGYEKELSALRDTLGIYPTYENWQYLRSDEKLPYFPFHNMVFTYAPIEAFCRSFKEYANKTVEELLITKNFI